ncbi:ABC transporter substrate-binding protein [Leadbettera azotonutricia]|uniref:Putative extracellular solute-binding protein, family 1 n=1 Tax=Leadbettera azotonutricia (strain ATCC BAA-888 / DSM 13862 / ZAS-9) TaxID=545695 RepID=F5YEB2_LEAAZ|nr:sugar ABC transporter substrate-binding protein [Leadbettera azotonutricia]AEF81866.1 putative extracellular solute-binding protein, family 1 [Leadbettera azotonutricia ZAS-9]
MKKIVLVMLVIMMSAAMVFAGGGGQSSSGFGAATGSSPSNIVLRWAFWGSEARVKASQAAIDAFQAANPGIVVNIEVSGGTGDHFNKVDTQLAGGNGPDIIQMGGNYPDYIAKGVPLNLDPYKGGLLDVSTIDTGAIAAGTIGHLYAVSTGATIPALIYNKTLLEKAGVALPKVTMTWEEFRAYLASIKPRLPAGVYPLEDFGSTASGSTGFGYWLRWNGTPIYDDVSGTTKVTVAEAKKFLDLFKDYRDNGFVPPADISAGYAETNVDSSSLIAGKVAIGFIVSNQFGNYQSATTDVLEIIELPGAAATKALWPQLSQVYTINSASKNLEAAVKFVNFLVNSPEAGKVIGNDRGISSSSTFRQGASAVASDTDKKVFAYHDVAGSHTSPETPHLPNDTELNSTLNLIYQRVAFGQATTAAGAQELYALLVRLAKK